LIVVSDTSPILNLERIGHLRLLEQVYRRVLIPPAVVVELAAYGFDATAAPWLVIRQSSGAAFAARRFDLDAGEAEAIALAMETGADVLLMDERLGRRTAREAGIPVVGVLGVLSAAKNRGLISACGPLVTALLAGNFWLDEELVRRFLALQGEL
jgi:predicted nucleic acid-binding protein